MWSEPFFGAYSSASVFNPSAARRALDEVSGFAFGRMQRLALHVMSRVAAYTHSQRINRLPPSARLQIRTGLWRKIQRSCAPIEFRARSGPPPHAPTPL